MSGYDKSPDYGGPDPKPYGWVLPAILFAAIAALVFACGANAKPKRQVITGIGSVIDGDTIEVHGTRIRLWGIDAPESAQACLSARGAKEPTGRRSAFELSDLIESKTIKCEARGTDRYKRTIGLCRAGGEDISKTMVARGWARAYMQYSSDYAIDEAAAKSAARGMWAWACEAPWDWRAARR